MAKVEGLKVQKIEYYRLVRPPTLKQYVYRRVMAQVMEKLRGEIGVGIDPNTNKSAPLSAIKAREMLKGVKAEDLIAQYPDWVEDYRRKYGDKKS